MNSKNVYNKLNDIKNKILGYMKEEALKSLDSLLLELKNDIEASVNPYSSKKRLTACSNYAKKVSKNRNILGYTMQYNNKQVYTDGFFMVSLCDDDKTTIPDVTTNKNITPLKIDFLIKYFNDFYKYKYEIKINDFLNYAKLKDNKTYEININDDEKILFSVDNLKHFIDFMNFKSDETIILYCNSIYAIQYCKKDNGSEGVILPLRQQN